MGRAWHSGKCSSSNRRRHSRHSRQRQRAVAHKGRRAVRHLQAGSQAAMAQALPQQRSKGRARQRQRLGPATSTSQRQKHRRMRPLFWTLCGSGSWLGKMLGWTTPPLTQVGGGRGLALLGARAWRRLPVKATAKCVELLWTAAPPAAQDSLPACHSADAELDDDWAATQQQDAEDAYFADA